MRCTDPCAAVLPRDRLASTARRSSAACVAVLLVLASTSVSGAARADDAADTAAARVLGVEGVVLADQGKCAQAIEKLQRAEELHHAPSTAARLGECEIETGKIVAGTERLQRVVREPLPRNAPVPFVAAVARAQKVLDKAIPKIAMLRIAVKAPSGVKPAITLDGDPVPDAVLLSDRPTDPGKHTIGAAANGYVASSVDVSLGEGESRSVSLELRPAPSTALPPDAVSPPSSSAGWKAVGFTSLGLGVAGIGFGAVAGALVASKSNALSSGCDSNRVCPASQQSDLSAARTWATAANIGFIAGGAALVSGVVLLLTSKSTAAPSSDSARLGVSVGPTSIGVHGAF